MDAFVLKRLFKGSSSLCDFAKEPLGSFLIGCSFEAALFDSLKKFVCHDALSACFKQEMVKNGRLVEAVHSGNIFLGSFGMFSKELCDFRDILFGECRIVFSFFHKDSVFQVAGIAVVAVCALVGQSFLLHLLDNGITYQVVSDCEFQQIVIGALGDIVLFHQDASSPYRGSCCVLSGNIMCELIEFRQTPVFSQVFRISHFHTSSLFVR